MINAILSGLLLAGAPEPALADPKIEWSAPDVVLIGGAYEVQVTVETGAEGATIQGWWLTPAAFNVDGKPLAGSRKKSDLELAPNTKLSIGIDLGPALAQKGGFQLAYQPAGKDARAIKAYERAAEGVDFMHVPAAELADYMVLMKTIHGDMLFELWPDVAPNHVRNFLDLAHRGFYENIPFHRVSPTFMIQGGNGAARVGDTTRWNEGNNTRRVDAEFNDRKHLRGVLSAARVGGDINSATSQFFVMCVPYPSLDGQYSGFGKMKEGDSTLSAIANAKGRVGRDGTVTPSEPQLILDAYAIRSL